MFQERTNQCCVGSEKCTRYRAVQTRVTKYWKWGDHGDWSQNEHGVTWMWGMSMDGADGRQMEEGGGERATETERRKGRIEGESISVLLWGVTESWTARRMCEGVLTEGQSSWLLTPPSLAGLTWMPHWHITLIQHWYHTHTGTQASTHSEYLKFTVSPAQSGGADSHSIVYNGFNINAVPHR